MTGARLSWPTGGSVPEQKRVDHLHHTHTHTHTGVCFTLQLGEEGTDQLGAFLLIAFLCDVTCQRQDFKAEVASGDENTRTHARARARAHTHTHTETTAYADRCHPLNSEQIPVGSKLRSRAVHVLFIRYADLAERSD